MDRKNLSRRFPKLIPDNSFTSYNNARYPFYISEGLIKTYTPEQTARIIAKHLKLEYIPRLDELFMLNGLHVLLDKRNTSNGYFCVSGTPHVTETTSLIITILISDDPDGENRKIVERTMNFAGWFLVKSFDGTDSEELYDYGYCLMMFEQKFTPEVTDFVKKHVEYLYHIIASNRVDKVLRNGLSPRDSEMDGYNREGRIYFFIVEPEKSEFDLIAKQINTEKKGDRRTEKYSLLKIDVSKLKTNRDVHFFNDPRFDGVIYTKDNIPGDFIEVIGETKI